MIKYEIHNNTLTIHLSGNCDNKITKNTINKLYKILEIKGIRHYLINLDSIVKFDISFLVLLNNYIEKIKSLQRSVRFIANTQDSQKMLEIFDDIAAHKNAIKTNKTSNAFYIIISAIGKYIWDSINTCIDFVSFIGSILYTLFISLFHPSKIRWKAINYHIYSGVITAMPIIFMVSFIVGGVIAYQGAVTLSKMGFIQASVEMTAKLTLREIGPFIVALIVAGRSASSYTAQIGVMKMTEELGAMKTMNFNALHFIVIPRFIAMIASFPLMVFLSDLIAIFGCMVFLKLGFNITYSDYILQLKEFVGMNSFWVGIIKAPFYAMTIVVIGCFIGFRVENNTQSVGEKTTASVVYALFGVILVNALFSLIFTELQF